MVRSVDTASQEQVIAELKRLIRTTRYETIEELEDAVDAFLWGCEESAIADAPPST